MRIRLDKIIIIFSEKLNWDSKELINAITILFCFYVIVCLRRKIIDES